MSFDEKIEVATLVLEYLKVLVWPIVVLSVVCLFRKHILSIVKRLRDAELPGGVKINLTEEISEVERLSTEVKEVVPPPGKKGTPVLPLNEANSRMLKLGLQPSPSGLDLDYYKSLARQDPNIALAGLRIELETLVKNVAKQYEIGLEKKIPFSLLVRELHSSGSISNEQRMLIEKIATVCNAAVHGERISVQEAEQVIDSARILAENYISWLSWGFPQE